MTVVQWLCENQVLASVIMTALSVGLIALTTYVYFTLLDKYHAYRKKKEDNKTLDEKVDDSLKAKKNYDKFLTIINWIFIVFLAVLALFMAFTEDPISAIPMLLLLTVIFAPSVFKWLEKKNQMVSDILFMVFLATIIVFAIFFLGQTVYKMYQWWILHICTM